MLSVCDTSFCCSCSSQHSGNLEIQPPGREEPREPGFIPSETLTPAEAGTGSTELWQCAAAWHLHLLCCSWDKTLTLQPSLPPNTQATSTASSTHGLGAEAKKRPKQLMWHEMLHCKRTFMHRAAAPHSCVRCLSWRGTTPTSRWGCAVQMLLAPSLVSSATKATCSQQVHPWPWLKV